MDEQNTTIAKNINTFNIWKNRLSQNVIGSIRYKKMPDSVDTTYVERAECYGGKVIFFRTSDGLVALRGFGSNLPNIYNIPTERTVNAANGFVATLSNEDSVIMYNNNERKPAIQDIITTASRLANYDMTIECNVAAQKTPLILRTDRNGKLSIKNAYAQYDINRPVIIVDEDFDLNRIAVLDLKVPYIAKDLMLLQNDVLKQFYLNQGILSFGAEKAERENAFESQSKAGVIEAAREAKLKPRREALHLMYTMWPECFPDGEPEVEFVDSGNIAMPLNPFAGNGFSYSPDEEEGETE